MKSCICKYFFKCICNVGSSLGNEPLANDYVHTISAGSDRHEQFHQSAETETFSGLLNPPSGLHPVRYAEPGIIAEF